MRAMIAARTAGAATRPLTPAPSPSPSSSSSPKVVLPSRAQLPGLRSLPAASRSATATSVSLLALFSAPIVGEAKAFSIAKEEIMASIDKVESAVDQAEKVGSSVLDVSQSIFKTITDALKPAADVALPALQKAGEEALKLGSPVVVDASNQAKKALQNAGVDSSSIDSALKTVTDAAQQTTKVIEGAKPVASSTLETISASDPAVLAVSAGAFLLAYLLFPSALSAISFSFRGYRGNLSPAQTLDLISTQNYFLIDIRSENDKNKTGVPRVPSGAKNKLIPMPLEELPSKLKGIVRDSKKVEAELVALKISYLKRVNKGSNIIILDSYSDTAKVVARALTSLGLKNCWVVTDGFSGSKGWFQSRLGTESYNASFAEILSPSRIIPAGRTGTRKLLPGGVDG